MEQPILENGTKGVKLNLPKTFNGDQNKFQNSYTLQKFTWELTKKTMTTT